MRCFVAIELPAELRPTLITEGRRIAGDAGARIVSHDNLHITLLFLGEVPPRLIDRVKSSLEEAVLARTPFEITLGRLGTFGKAPRSVTLWADVESADEQLSYLQSKIAIALNPFIQKPETRPYSAHVTLARSKTNFHVPEDCGPIGSAFVVLEVVLMKSTLSRNGPRYEVLSKIPLRGMR